LKEAIVAAFQITKIRTVQPFGADHEHIDAAELGGRADWRFDRDYLIGQLRDPDGDRYYTWNGSKRATVVVRGCPRCSFGSYITTLPDSTTTNNLLSLPRF
jgi:hypothetical protein